MWLRYNIYFWQGINYLGEKSSGHIIAYRKSNVKEILENNKVIVKSISKKNRFKTFFLGNYISSKNLTSFTQQTAATLAAGMSFIQAIKLAASYQSNYIFKQLLYTIINEVESGIQFSVGIRKYPSVFNSFYCNMIEIAENSGAPNLVFTKLANYMQQAEQFRQKLQKILLYPILLIFLTLIVLISVILLIIPQFTALYTSFGANLPFITKLIISMTDFIQYNWLSCFFLFIVSICLGLFLYNNSQQCMKFIDKLALLIPFFGKLFHKLILAKCINILYATYTSGTPLLECLQHAKLVAKNHVYLDFVNSLIVRIAAGESFKVALNNSNFFPKTVINILSLGDESSNLEEMLSYLTNFYDKDIQNSFITLHSLLEPLIMAFLGLIIGFLVFAIYYPIINVGAFV